MKNILVQLKPTLKTPVFPAAQFPSNFTTHELIKYINYASDTNKLYNLYVSNNLLKENIEETINKNNLSEEDTLIIEYEEILEDKKADIEFIGDILITKMKVYEDILYFSNTNGEILTLDEVDRFKLNSRPCKFTKMEKAVYDFDVQSNAVLMEDVIIVNGVIVVNERIKIKCFCVVNEFVFYATMDGIHKLDMNIMHNICINKNICEATQIISLEENFILISSLDGALMKYSLKEDKFYVLRENCPSFCILNGSGIFVGGINSSIEKISLEEILENRVGIENYELTQAYHQNNAEDKRNIKNVMVRAVKHISHNNNFMFTYTDQYFLYVAGKSIESYIQKMVYEYEISGIVWIGNILYVSHGNKISIYNYN